jgi:hypothetical protein
VSKPSESCRWSLLRLAPEPKHEIGIFATFIERLPRPIIFTLVAGVESIHWPKVDQSDRSSLYSVGICPGRPPVHSMSPHIPLANDTLLSNIHGQVFWQSSPLLPVPWPRNIFIRDPDSVTWRSPFGFRRDLLSPYLCSGLLQGLSLG